VHHAVVSLTRVSFSVYKIINYHEIFKTELAYFSWYNQNWESNEIEDVSNHLDSNNLYPVQHIWHSTTQSPYIAWTKPSSVKPPTFITKPKPWNSFTNKYQNSSSSTINSTTNTTPKYHTYKPFPSSTTEDLSSPMPSSTTTEAVTHVPRPPISGMVHLVSASINDKGTRE